MTSARTDQHPLLITQEAWAGLLAAYRSMRAPGPVVRLVVKRREITGLVYDMYFVCNAAVTAKDVSIADQGLTVILDPHAAKQLKGAVLDRVDGGFIIENPNPAWSSNVLSALVSNNIGLRGHSEEGKAAATNKYLMRVLLDKSGVRNPLFFRVPASTNPKKIANQVPYPCVIKPLALSASCGVMRADNAEEFVCYFDRLKSIMKRADIAGILGDLADHILIESYIAGDEVVVEGLVSGGTLQVFAILDKPDPLEGPFFEETIYVRPTRYTGAVGRDIERTSQAVVTALGLNEGPVHIEARVNEEGIWPLDVGARIMGGQCSQALRFEGGQSLEQIVVLHALGQKIGDLKFTDPASGVMMIPTPKRGVLIAVDGISDASKVPLIDDVCIAIPRGHRVEPPPEGMDYLGFIFAYGDTPHRVTDALRQAHACLTLRIDENGVSDSLAVTAREPTGSSAVQ